MAIDTQGKRWSALNFGDGVLLDLLPEPDGAIDQADKVHLLGLYIGVLPFATGLRVLSISLVTFSVALQMSILQAPAFTFESSTSTQYGIMVDMASQYSIEPTILPPLQFSVTMEAL